MARNDINQLENMQRIQAASLRRIHMLPGGIKDLIDASTCSDPLLTDDGQGMSYIIGGSITLTIRPFKETIELVDNTGNNGALVIDLGDNGDFDRSKILAIAGYASLVKRDSAGKTGTDWVQRLNGAPALA